MSLFRKAFNGQLINESRKLVGKSSKTELPLFFIKRIIFEESERVIGHVNFKSSILNKSQIPNPNQNTNKSIEEIIIPKIDYDNMIFLDEKPKNIGDLLIIIHKSSQSRI